jgi:hypothetical protein
VRAANYITLYGRRQFPAEGAEQGVLITSQWGGKAVEFSYETIKVGVSLFQAFELCLIHIFFIRDAIDLLEGLQNLCVRCD